MSIHFKRCIIMGKASKFQNKPQALTYPRVSVFSLFCLNYSGKMPKKDIILQIRFLQRKVYSKIDKDIVLFQYIQHYSGRILGKKSAHENCFHAWFQLRSQALLASGKGEGAWDWGWSDFILSTRSASVPWSWNSLFLLVLPERRY